MSQFRVCLLCLFATASSVFGQATARLTGNVLDGTGAAVPGVAISVLNVQTGTERETAEQ